MAKLKVSFIEFPRKEPHKWKRLGLCVVHDADAEFTLNTFDFRYKGQRSRLGKYLLDLHAKGVDISGIGEEGKGQLVKSKAEHDLTVVLAKRLYKALVGRTIVIDKSSKGAKTMATKNDETWDWNHPAARNSRYYKMASVLIDENGKDKAIRAVNLIAGYA